MSLLALLGPVGAGGTGVASRTRITCDKLLGNFTIKALFDEEKRQMANRSDDEDEEENCNAII
jgi:hypothetical protein